MYDSITGKNRVQLSKAAFFCLNYLILPLSVACTLYLDVFQCWKHVKHVFFRQLSFTGNKLSVSVSPTVTGLLGEKKKKSMRLCN